MVGPIARTRTYLYANTTRRVQKYQVLATVAGDEPPTRGPFSTPNFRQIERNFVMKTAIATIVAAASFSLLAAQVSAETISTQEWVASQHFNGPGVGAVRAPEFTVNQDPQAWQLSERNSPPKIN